MEVWNILALAIIQGITEFLPVSSSGHLILWPLLTGQPDQGLSLDIAVHVGTLFAVIFYFRREVALAAWGFLRLLKGRADTQGARLALLLIIATVPVVVLGLVVKLSGANDIMRGSVKVIGWSMLGFGILLWVADRFFPDYNGANQWNIKHAVIFGLWQAVALIPGASRSGICITGARFLGYDRTSAAKIAMLMSIPTIIASGVLLAKDTLDSGLAFAVPELLAILCAFGAAMLALKLMMRFLQSVSFTPYVIYRIILGTILIVI